MADLASTSPDMISWLDNTDLAVRTLNVISSDVTFALEDAFATLVD